MKTHELKCNPRFYAGVDDGSKPFECRRNDRGFTVGDTLRLREFDPEYGYTGREHFREVTYILHAEDGPWIAPGYVCLGLGHAAEVEALKSDNRGLLTCLNAEASARITAEGRALASREVLEAYEAWEASLFHDAAAWPVGAALPALTEGLWDSLMVLQVMRNAVLAGGHGWTDDEMFALSQAYTTAGGIIQSFIYGETYCIRNLSLPHLQQTLWTGRNSDECDRRLVIEHMRHALNIALAVKKED